MSDKVDDIVKKIPISDQDVYVTSEGRVLRGGDELTKCGVRDGCTVEVMRRLRGGGRHKDKKNKVEKKQVAILRRSESPQAQLEQKDEKESKCDEGQAISEDAVQQVLERGLDVLERKRGERLRRENRKERLRRERRRGECTRRERRGERRSRERRRERQRRQSSGGVREK